MFLLYFWFLCLFLFEYEIVDVELSKIANVEKKLPDNYIKENGYEITKECRDYLKPYVFDANFSLYQDEDGKPIYFELDWYQFRY